MQQRFFELAQKFVDAGHADGVVEDAETILREWGTVLDELRQGDWDTLSTKLDWVLKKRLIDRYIEKHGCQPLSPHLRAGHKNYQPSVPPGASLAVG